MSEHKAIFEKWHEYASKREVEKLLALYHEEATLESPLVPILMKQSSGILQGREQIEAFLHVGTQKRPNELVRWYRDGTYFSSGNMLVWEYPRETPDGDQIDILEVMQIERGLIMKQRIYWGWVGVNLLLGSQ